MKHVVWLVVLALVGLSRAERVDARRVVHIPTLGELCPGNAEWDKVAACIKRQGEFKLLRDEKTVKLVHLPQLSRIGGLYVFTLGAKRWEIRGELRGYQELDVLGFQRVTYGKHTGYRVDAGLAMSTVHSLDGESTVPALLRQQLSLVCFDDNWGCAQMMTSCDLMLHGKAYFSFRGKVVYANKQLEVIGDRTNAGPYCQQPQLVMTDRTD